MMVVVGRIGRPHGVRGDVTVEVRTDDPDERFVPGATFVTDPAGRGPLTVTTVRYSGPRMLLRFVGVDDRNAAEALRDTLLQVDNSELPDLAGEDEYYDHQLVGLAVVDTHGTVLGEVTAVDHAPASSILTVARPDGREELVPFVAALVPDVDIDRATVTIDPPDGMFAE